MFLNMTSEDSKENKESIHLSNFPKYDGEIDYELISKVDSLKKVIESGRAVRKKANIKVRQPLDHLKIFMLDNDLKKFITEQQDIIIDELNIKNVIFSDDLNDFGDFSLKPNFKSIKSKFEDDMQEVMKKIKTFDAQKIAKDYLKGKAFIKNELGISREDIILDLNASDGFESFLSNNVVVALSTTISKELKIEGVFRDLIRHIQIMRKEADFNIDDRILIGVKFPEDLKNEIASNKEFFMNEVLCTDIMDNLENFDYNSPFKYENNEIEIYLKKL